MNGTILHVLYYVLYLALPLWCAFWFWSGKARDKFDVLARIWGVPLYLAWAYVLGPWAWGPYYLRYALLLLVALILAQGWRLLVKLPFLKRKPIKSWMAAAAWGSAGLFFIATAGPAFLAGRPTESAVELSFPLRDGTYAVVQGGNAAGLNNHALVTPQRFAVDISKLGPWASRANHPFPTSNPQFSIYGQPVHAPCSGHAIRVVDGLKDSQPHDFDSLDKLKDEEIAGNHVVIRCKGADVLLAHFKAGTLNLREGQPVSEGEFLGRVGNSGNTSEPHLHIHAQKMSEDLSFWNERNAGIPILFNGRFLERSDLFRAPSSAP